MYLCFINKEEAQLPLCHNLNCEASESTETTRAQGWNIFHDEVKFYYKLSERK